MAAVLCVDQSKMQESPQTNSLHTAVKAQSFTLNEAFFHRCCCLLAHFVSYFPLGVSKSPHSFFLCIISPFSLFQLHKLRPLTEATRGLMYKGRVRIKMTLSKNLCKDRCVSKGNLRRHVPLCRLCRWQTGFLRGCTLLIKSHEEALSEDNI